MLDASDDDMDTFFEASDKTCSSDSCSDASDASFHSITQDLKMMAMEDVLHKPDNASDEKTCFSPIEEQLQSKPQRTQEGLQHFAQTEEELNLTSCQHLSKGNDIIRNTKTNIKNSEIIDDIFKQFKDSLPKPEEFSRELHETTAAAADMVHETSTAASELEETTEKTHEANERTGAPGITICETSSATEGCSSHNQTNIMADTEECAVTPEPCDPEVFDVLCLDDVKAADEDCELKLKDMEVEMTEDEKESARVKAMEEKVTGNSEFVEGNFASAITHYNNGLSLCPLFASNDRAALYQNRAVAYVKMGSADELAVHSCSRALELQPDYMKARLRRARLQETLEKLDEALLDYKTVLEQQPGHKDAAAAVRRLPPLIEERNEKLKTEMLDKLKGLGNMFLRPFGLSTQNFTMIQDQKTGGYNIQFQQQAPPPP